jgi:hypothetical protein
MGEKQNKKLRRCRKRVRGKGRVELPAKVEEFQMGAVGLHL